MQQAVAWLLRLINVLKNSGEPNRYRGCNLLNEEINSAKLCLVKYVQSVFYSDEISKLKAGRNLKRSSDILSLASYLDKDSFLRVSGSLSAMHDTSVHPYMIPSASP